MSMLLCVSMRHTKFDHIRFDEIESSDSSDETDRAGRNDWHAAEGLVLINCTRHVRFRVSYRYVTV